MITEDQLEQQYLDWFQAQGYIPVTTQEAISEHLSDINSRQCFVIMVVPL